MLWPATGPDLGLREEAGWSPAGDEADGPGVQCLGRHQRPWLIRWFGTGVQRDEQAGHEGAVFAADLVGEHVEPCHEVVAQCAGTASSCPGQGALSADGEVRMLGLLDPTVHCRPRLVLGRGPGGGSPIEDGLPFHGRPTARSADRRRPESARPSGPPEQRNAPRAPGSARCMGRRRGTH